MGGRIVQVMKNARGIVGSAAGLLAVGFLALLFILGLTFWLGERARINFDEVERARELGATATALRSALQAAESSQRGYLVTGNQIYLAPFSTAKDEAARQIARLQELVEPEGMVTTSFARLKVVVEEKIAEMTETIRLQDDERGEELTALLRSNRGKALMDEGNIFLSAIIRSSDARVTTEVDSQKESFVLLRTATIIAVLLIILVTGLVILLIARYVRDLRQKTQEVDMLNATLERRVEERTAELKHARDRAEILLSEVNHRVANSLAIVAGMVGLQARAAASEEARQILSETRTRINAVALVHKKLYTSSDVRFVAMEDYLPTLLEQLEASMRQDGHGAILRKEIAPLKLPTDQTVSLGVIAAEWVTNAFKYAYPEGRGEIRVLLKGGDGDPVELLVEDDGIGRSPDASPRGTGLGTGLVSAMAQSLGANVEYIERQPGTSARLIMAAH